MKRKLVQLLAGTLALGILLTACGSSAAGESGVQQSQNGEEPLKVLVLIPGTRGDMSVNDLAARGLGNL